MLYALTLFRVTTKQVFGSYSTERRFESDGNHSGLCAVCSAQSLAISTFSTIYVTRFPTIYVAYG